MKAYMLATTDWSSIVRDVVGFLTLIFIWWKSNRIEKKVEVVHALTNSGAGVQARTLEVSAKALAISDPTEENRKLAENATIAVKEHDAAQAKADAIDGKTAGKE